MSREWHRARTLAALAPELAELPRARLYPLWRRALRHSASRTRRDLLGDLRALVPVVVRLGGAKAIGEVVDAVREVGERWP